MVTLIFIFSIGLLFSQEKLAISNIVPLENKSHILLLNNGSIWKLLEVEYRSQTWSEWWNTQKILKDEDFVWDKDSWHIEDNIEIKENDSLGIDINYLTESQKQKITNYRFLIDNQTTSKKSFAKPISIDQVIKDLKEFAEDRYNKGYSYGHSIGYSLGYSSGYHSGYHDGSMNH